jgi:glutathione S-transferase
MSKDVIELYHWVDTRSFRPLWLLEELGIEYKLIRTPIQSQLLWHDRARKSLSDRGELKDSNGDVIELMDNHSRSYLNLNPGGTLPTLKYNDHVMWEAGAICMYLCDMNPESGLSPDVSSLYRTEYLKWMFYVTSTMEYPLVDLFLHTKMLPKEKRRQSVVEYSLERYKKILVIINNSMHGNNPMMAQRPYMIGHEFSVVDIMVSSTLNWFPELLYDFPHLQSYVNRCIDRPSFQDAIDKNE